MSAVDPVSALQALNESDERQRSPVRGVAKPFLEIAKLLFGDQFSSVDAVSTVVNWADQRAQQNLKELVDVIASEVKYLGKRLSDASAAHGQFVESEMPGLILDAIRRTEGIRSKKRIARIARILVHAAELGPKSEADYAEEMLRIATELSDWDVRVLDSASKEFVRQYSSNNVQEAESVISARAWLQMNSGISGDELASVGAKLQSFGLTSRIEGQTGDQNSYRVLERGRRFIEYIRSAE